MRFKITLEIDKKSSDVILPINYQYALSAFIYHTINKGNEDFAMRLHEREFMLENKSFELFSFSNLVIPKFKQNDDRLIVLSDKISFVLSFFSIELTESFVFGLFADRKFSLGDKESKIYLSATSVEQLLDPDFSSVMIFKALSPIVISTKTNSNSKYATYLHPGDKDYIKKIKNNLLYKYAAYCDYYRKEMDYEYSQAMDFMILSEPNKKEVLIKPGSNEESKVIGYEYKFSISAYPELIRTGFYAGFGEKNSIGFGCCGVV